MSYVDHQVLRVSGGNIGKQIMITTAGIVLGLHSDRTRFTSWVQNKYTEMGDAQVGLVIKHGNKVAHVWRKARATRDNLVA